VLLVHDVSVCVYRASVSSTLTTPLTPPAAYYSHVNEASLSAVSSSTSKSLAPYAAKTFESGFVDEYVTADGQYIRVMNVTAADGCHDVCREDGVTGDVFVSGAASLPLPLPTEEEVQ
jgi:hypothetical protein